MALSSRCGVCGKLARDCVCDLPPSWREQAGDMAVLVFVTLIAYVAFCAVPHVDLALGW